MLNLLDLRDKIDKIDNEMVRLYELRMDLCEQVARYKIQTGKPVFDKERELSKLSSLSAKTHNGFNSHGIQEIYQQIMSISRKRQYQLLEEHDIDTKSDFQMIDCLKRNDTTVVFQGVEGAYSFAAMNSFFGKDIKNYNVPTWKDAMEEIKKQNADYAVLPIENSTAGIVQDIYDLLTEYDHYIVGEQIIPCEHALLGVPGASLDDIKFVYSHAQALMQCKEFLEEHDNWEQVKYNNTAASAKKIAEDGIPSQAAIASTYAAEFYGLDILKQGIYSNPNNSTRFIIVTKNKIFTPNARKISISYELPHESGSLYNSLSHMIYNGLNMTKIESRPITNHNWEYRFFVDFEGNLNECSVKNALRGLSAEVRNLRVHGNY